MGGGRSNTEYRIPNTEYRIPRTQPVYGIRYSEYGIRRARSVVSARLLRLRVGFRGLLQPFGLVVLDQVREQFSDVAVEHVREAVRGEIDAMVGDAVLREVVGADLLRPLAGPHLAAPVLGDRFLLLLHLDFVEART